MAIVSGYPPVEQGAACYTALRQHAETAKAGGDSRTRERCNYVREMPGWQITVIDAQRLDKAHTMIITPTGHHYLSRAPDRP